MHRDVFSTTWLVLFNVLPVRAAFSEFFFAGNNGSSNALKTCPDSGFECAPPSICSFDDRTENYYCCIPAFEDAVCWGPSEGCNGGDSTTPAGNQQACGSGINTFCCLESSEVCTESANQINICWSRLNNPLASLNASAINETAQSLESARPSAATYAISLSVLQSLTSTTATPSSASQSSLDISPTASVTSAARPTTTAASFPSASAATEDSDSGISGGAIGGIVGGVIGGLAIFGLAGIFLWRKRKNDKGRNPYEPANSDNGGGALYSLGPRTEMDSNQAYVEAPVTEKYGHAINPVVEVPADRAPAELPVTGPTYGR
ncbi:hypothetical protein DDE82_007492 [Stemphylium lycopersici]|uniref:Uncharacterized protein n=1 Tax=Stemphylium lycopersici TaxID=183478 RepID=A0A364N8C3_STELY|nr:hypothetical protein TW65_07324 [Stemphylium lycopersici]RAR00250.1 hypothetical protein DDE82_007492 [Stemphylium lycopersici]RAR13413.1 hypothetical protein DDE83_003277 [Stemphylium lycopersici]